MTILLMLHTIVPLFILLVAVIAIIKFTLGWLRGGEFKGMDRGLMAGFSGLMDLQVTLGIIYLLWNGFAQEGFPAFRIEHAITMIIAAVVAHLPARWKNVDDKTRFRNNLFVIVAVIVLVVIGVSLLIGN